MFALRSPHVVAAVLAASIVGTLAPTAPVSAHRGDPLGIHHFMWALSRWESGGNYRARNKQSLAYGKYQIMPFNWPVWAERYLGNAKATQSPRNQERVARAKFIDLYRWLGSWKRVAYWWLTGNTQPRSKFWTNYAKRYVYGILYMYKRALKQRPVVTTPSRQEVRAKPKGTVARRPKPQPIARSLPVLVSIGTVNIRTGPGVRYGARGYLMPGARLGVLGTARAPDGRTWIKFRMSPGRLGWVTNKFLRRP